MNHNFCVIGDPIEHSLSPAIYNELFRRYDMPDCSYEKVRVAKAELPEFISTIPERGICGFNVTMPLKEAVMSFLSQVDAEVCSGVNTVVVKNQKLCGWSTDAPGFRKSLDLHGRSYAKSRVVFIGCGGAAQALIHDALLHDVNHLIIINRTPARALDFENDPRVTVASFDSLDEHMEQCDILVNATPLGMHGCSHDFVSLDFLSRLPSTALVADLIYNPSETAFLREARCMGHETMNGLWMLIWQAFFAFKHFTGILPNMEDFETLKSLLETDQN